MKSGLRETATRDARPIPSEGFSGIESPRALEDELHANEGRFRYVFDQSPVAKSLTRPSGEIEVNRAFLDMLGYTESEIQERGTWQHLTHPDDMANSQAVVDSLLSGERSVARFEKRYLHKDGSIVWAELQTGLRRDANGEPDFFITTVLDITERRQAEAALQASEAGYSALVEQMIDGVVVADESGAIAVWNTGMVSLSGIEKCDAIGMPIWAIEARMVPDELRTPDLADRIQAAFENVAKCPEQWSQEPYDHAVVRADGTRRIVQDSPFVVVTEHDVRLCAVLRDITDRRQLETDREEGLQRLAKAYASTVEIVSQVAEVRDPYTAGHQRRVAELAVAISEGVGMTAEQTEEIRIAALLHDIGKLSVPLEILSKLGKLTDIEFELIKGHSEAGYLIIAAADLEGPTAEIVRQHHERCDGTGYPRGLGADELLPASKVIAVADVVEAMVSHRPYRPALDVNVALAEIERGEGLQYDADVCEVCLRLFREQGFVFSEA
jgi:PAS domain S-box-containing protein